MEEDHRLRVKAIKMLVSHPAMQNYQERQTRMNLLYVSLANDFLAFIMAAFLRDVDDRLRSAYDVQELKELYDRITDITGEPLMETLNLQIKQRFLVVPLVTLFIQGLTSNLIFCLICRDEETNKQIFQLLMNDLKGL